MLLRFLSTIHCSCLLSPLSFHSQGFSTSLLKELYESSKYTGDYQVKYLLEMMLSRQEITAADVLSRVNFLITGWLVVCLPVCFSILLLGHKESLGYATTIFVWELIWIIFGDDEETTKKTRLCKKCVHHSMTTNKRREPTQKQEVKHENWNFRLLSCVLSWRRLENVNSLIMLLFADLADIRACSRSLLHY